MSIQNGDLNKILSSVRLKIGLNDDLHDFDAPLIMEINTALNILTQLGIGPYTGFRITGEDETWAQFFGEDDSDPRYEMAKDYVAKRAHLKFDPPQASYLVNVLENELAELEWRLSIQRDRTFPTDEE